MVPRDKYEPERQLMVAEQLAARDIRDARVLQAMATVPRHEFVPRDQRALAYTDRALEIGCGQTISQPYMVALMCQLLQVAREHSVLEVGAGSGYQAAVLGQLARKVHAFEIVAQLASSAHALIGRLGYSTVNIHTADGTLGCPDQAPFDRIIIAAASPEIPPPLVEQLAEGGRIVAPVGSRRSQIVVVGARKGDELCTWQSTPCVFVPLRGEHGWHDA